MAVGSFSEYEQRFLLTEVLKTSNVPVQILLSVIQEQQFEPNWDDVGLPGGRNVKSCTAELSRLLGNPPGDSRLEGFRNTPRGVTRTQSATGFYAAATPASKTREIKPKPASNGAGNPTSSTPATGATRKRGRPSNAEIAQREKEATERGEVYPASSATKRKSIAELSAGDAPAPGSEPPVKRGRGRPPKNRSTEPNPEAKGRKPSEDAGPAEAEVTEEALQHDASAQGARDSLQVVARASESLIPSHKAATTSAINKMLNHEATTEAPSLEHTSMAV